MTAPTGDRLSKHRAKQEQLGCKRRELSLTESDWSEVQRFVAKLREGGGIADCECRGVEFQIKSGKSINIKDATSCTAQIAALGLEKGNSVYGFTLGQFSISDLIETILDRTGPADVTISTWTASAAKIEDAFVLFESGKITSCRFLLDPGFRSRQPKFCKVLIDRFGNNAIRTVANHAKFIVIRNEEWNVVIKTSMNLNNNPRLENYEICEGRQLAEYIDNFVDYIFRVSDPSENFGLQEAGGLNRKANQISEEDMLAAIGL